jgi:hypothetical protein
MIHDNKCHAAIWRFLRPALCVSAEVFCVATVHALTTEAEEVMGLLLGDVHVSSSQPCPADSLAQAPSTTYPSLHPTEATVPVLLRSMGTMERLLLASPWLCHRSGQTDAR